MRFWSQEEIAVLEKYYYSEGAAFCSELIERSPGAIRAEAAKLGIKGNNGLVNLSGKKFGRLTVLERVEDYISPGGHRLRKWKCKCECGKVKNVTAGALTSGHTKSCGCYQKERASEANFINLVGEKFGRLTVLERVADYISPSGNKLVCWKCKCDCRNICVVTAGALTSGATKSCGCYKRQRSSETKLIDLTGQKFGRLTVLERVEDHIQPDGTKRATWRCKCDCDSETLCIVQGNCLLTGRTKSCGCYRQESRSGENSNLWKGGITPLTVQIRTSTQYKQWRGSVFERDDYTCQFSDNKGVKLVAHHIKPFHKILEENKIETFEQALECKELWNVDNGITLSEDWHSQASDNELAFHRVYGTGNFTEEDFKTWFLSIKQEVA